MNQNNYCGLNFKDYSKSKVMVQYYSGVIVQLNNPIYSKSSFTTCKSP